MKLPVNAFLYVVSAGLLGVAGWTFYKTYPEQSQAAHDKRHNQGIAEARDLLAKTKGQNDKAERNWNYEGTWWKTAFLSPNVLGKDPPKQVSPEQIAAAQQAQTQVTVQPLEEIIELVTVVCDRGSGKGDLSHVVVRYKGQVDTPEWYQRENRPASAAAPMDSVAPGGGAQAGGRGGRGGRGGGGNAPRAATPMPASTAGAEILQRIWVAGDGSARFENKLWAPYSDIKLVRVSPDARSAFFVRPAPAPKPGEPPVPAKEEELFKTSMPMSQDVAAAVADILRTAAPDRLRGGKSDLAAAPANGNWIDDVETKKIDGRINVGRKDEQLYRENPNALLERVNAESYVSKTGSGLKGVVFRNIEPAIAQKFGVAQGEVLISLNDEKVETKADAMAVGKRQYNRGTRTFVAKFLSNGQVIERSYQLPDR